ncbi:nucleoside hydrolase [Nocardia sp. NPDC052566]|uniref:nucleoside hydrolase n=1 Tax=Nocardia sp. NPDC052566 TaxID=3364330 RepID=UPI0037C9356A
MICTDLGHGPDDLLALVIAAATLPVRLVVTSDEFGGGQRARLARYVLNLCGRTGVRVIAGTEIEGAESRWVCEGLVPAGVAPTSAQTTGSVRDAVRTVLREHPRAAWIGHGPLTNLARLVTCEPDLARQLVITQMGAPVSYRTPEKASRNLRIDPHSARVVLTAPELTMSLVTSDISLAKEIEIRADNEIYRLLSAHTAPRWARVLAQGYSRWFAHEQTGSIAADPLAIAAAAGLPFVQFDTEAVTISPDARMLLDPNGIRLRMSTTADYSGFRSWVVMVMRHVLQAGMGYDPSLITRHPGDRTIAPAVRAARIGVR